MEAFDKGIASGTFSLQLYSSAAVVNISNGHFTGVPVTFTTQ